MAQSNRPGGAREGCLHLPGGVREGCPGGGAPQGKVEVRWERTPSSAHPPRRGSCSLWAGAGGGGPQLKCSPDRGPQEGRGRPAAPNACLRLSHAEECGFTLKVTQSKERTQKQGLEAEDTMGRPCQAPTCCRSRHLGGTAIWPHVPRPAELLASETGPWLLRGQGPQASARPRSSHFQTSPGTPHPLPALAAPVPFS